MKAVRQIAVLTLCLALCYAQSKPIKDVLAHLNEFYTPITEAYDDKGKVFIFFYSPNTWELEPGIYLVPMAAYLYREKVGAIFRTELDCRRRMMKIVYITQLNGKSWKPEDADRADDIPFHSPAGKVALRVCSQPQVDRSTEKPRSLSH